MLASSRVFVWWFTVLYRTKCNVVVNLQYYNAEYDIEKK